MLGQNEAEVERRRPKIDALHVVEDSVLRREEAAVVDNRGGEKLSSDGAKGADITWSDGVKRERDRVSRLEVAGVRGFDDDREASS